MTVTLYNADCLDILPTLEAGSVDAVITDPPYGIGFTALEARRKGEGLNNRHKDGQKFGRFNGSIVGDDKEFDPRPWLQWPCLFFGAQYFYYQLPSGGSFHVWDKKLGKYDNFTLGDADFIWCSKPGAARIYRLMWMGLVRAEVERDGAYNKPGAHPNQKPIALMKWCFDLLGVPPGATVLDPFMGSGTTGVACVQTGRNFIGIEIDENYYNIAKKRVEEAQMQLPLLEAAD